MRGQAGAAVGLLLAAAMAIFPGCGGVGPEWDSVDGGAPSGAVGAACTAAGPAQAGNFRRELTVAGDTREYVLHVPPGYVPTRSTPVVLNLHGGGGTADIQSELTGFAATADAHGLLLVYPEGTRALVGRGRYWNAGECCGRAERREVDDVAFLSAVIDDVAASYCVDPSRVYATGMSNGGMMAYRLACELADRVAAIAPVAAVMVTERCAPSRPIPMLHIHGTADEVVRVEGGEYFGTRFEPIARSIETFVANNGCSPTPTVVRRAGATCERYGECTGSAEVRLCLIDGGGHTWPGGQERLLGGVTSTEVDANEVIWDFFAAHTLPEP